MKIQFRWLHKDVNDKNPELQFRRTDSENPHVYGKWSDIPCVFASEEKRPKTPSVRKKSVA